MMNDFLAKAVAALGAVEVAPGRFAFRAFGEGPWKIAEHLETWPINENSSPAYRVEMPAWWSPNQRFAVVYAGPITAGQMTRAFASVKEALAYKAFSDDRIITADLETGAEMPC